MSADFPPPQAPLPGGGNPYAQQPQSPYGPPPQGAPAQGGPAPYGAPPQGVPFGYPRQPGAAPGNPFDPAAYPPPNAYAQPSAPAAANPSLGILAGIVTAVVVAIAYGWIIGLTKHEIGYAAVGVGFAVGAVVGKVGGRSRTLPFAGLVLALAGVFLGQFLGEAIIGAHANDLSVTTALTDYTHEVFLGWKEDFDVMSFVFMAIAGLVGFQTPRRMNG
ncbi:hypothetical protein OG552_22255 [Streptomyces sp. NBC_01476]|uniref:hypothetical protein n=1 Tax=Streptomyces sp. NBC_01476 TaxID=2903881 RepID=UPI002E374352|nr:hypothetical protein [Streptomyces sp. NBC_01476]